MGAPMPLGEAHYVVIGLTNGPGFFANPCLADQVDWARRRKLLTAAYAVGSYPDRRTVARHATDGPFDGSTRLGALGNTGYQQARFNVASMAEAELRSPIVWIDVEPVPDFEWSTDPVANAAVVRGGRPRVRRGRLPGRGLLHAVPLGADRRRPGPRAAGVAGGGGDVAGRGGATLRRRLDHPGRRGGARAVARGRSGP